MHDGLEQKGEQGIDGGNSLVEYGSKRSLVALYQMEL
jgi:hypothetical protein